jgi:hypothetical protein
MASLLEKWTEIDRECGVTLDELAADVTPARADRQSLAPSQCS